MCILPLMLYMVLSESVRRVAEISGIDVDCYSVDLLDRNAIRGVFEKVGSFSLLCFMQIGTNLFFDLFFSNCRKC